MILVQYKFILSLIVTRFNLCEFYSSDASVNLFNILLQFHTNITLILSLQD